MYIGVSGNIGSGKSAMAQLLTQEFGCKLYPDDDEPNPYLANFYGDMQRWALNLQIYFLTKRFKAVQRAMWANEIVVQDRTIYEDAYIFVENLRHMGLLSRDDYNTYRELFETISAFIKPPELLIYLKSSVTSLVQHIRQRGVAYESAISFEYLTLLNNRYDEWVEGYKNNILTINVDDIDFVNNAADRTKVISAIASQVPGLLLVK